MTSKITLLTAVCSTIFFTLPQRSADIQFIRTAGQANAAEIAAGKIARQRGTTAAVRAFADSMVADHTTALEELRSLAQKEGVRAPDSPDTEHIESARLLSTLSGKSFDSMYISLQAMDHEVAIGLFQQESQTGRDSLMRVYATKYLPKLRHHLMMVKELQRK